MEVTFPTDEECVESLVMNLESLGWKIVSIERDGFRCAIVAKKGIR